MNFGKTLFTTAVGVAVVSAIPAIALAVPVVPNFTQGSMTSHTETTSKVTETINSIDYNTGWQYSVTGTNVDNNGENLNPGNTSGSVTVNLNNTNFKITNPGEAFQFTQTYQGPGVANQTVIQRITEVTSVTDTTSIFTQ